MLGFPFRPLLNWSDRRRCLERWKGKGVRCKSFNITEDLRQLEHVLCDKTGTLNKMSFKSCFVLGRDFKHDTDGIGGVQPS